MCIYESRKSGKFRFKLAKYSSTYSLLASQFVFISTFIYALFRMAKSPQFTTFFRTCIHIFWRVTLKSTPFPMDLNVFRIVLLLFLLFITVCICFEWKKGFFIPEIKKSKWQMICAINIYKKTVYFVVFKPIFLSDLRQLL